MNTELPSPSTVEIHKPEVQFEKIEKTEFNAPTKSKPINDDWGFPTISQLGILTGILAVVVMWWFGNN